MRICDDLRQAVLQAAIQGKLTKQLPEDGDAKGLLGVTLNSVIDGRKVKEKDIVDIAEDDKEFDIPANWQWVRLGSVGIVARGGSPRPIKDYITNSSDGINWIKIGDTDKGGKYITSVKEKIKPSGVSKSRFVHSGDFLLTNSMSFGRPYILKVDGCIHDGWLVISQPQKVFDDNYLYWLLSSNYAYMQFAGKVSGAVVKNLNSEKVANSVFPLPPLAEQQRIVARVEELMARIDDLEKTETELEKLKSAFPGDMKAALLQAAMQGKLTEQLPEDGLENTKYSVEIDDSDIPFDIPDTWVWTQLGSLVNKDEIGDGDWVLSNDMCSKSNNNLIQLGSVGNGVYINKEFKHVSDDFFESKHCSELFEKDILISRFISKDHMNVCILPELPGRLFTAVDVCWIRNNPERYLNTWLMWCLLCRGVQSQVMSYVAGTTRKRVSKANLLKVFIPLPPLAEQKRIVEKLDKLLPLCDGLVEE